MTTFNQRAPAKINLGLKIPFRYPNGYHHIVSLFLPIDLCDDIEATWGQGGGFELNWTNLLPHPFNQSPQLNRVFSSHSQDNLIYKAYQFCLARYAKITGSPKELSLSVNLAKRIPSPAGLGGGSSDAAAIVKTFLSYLEERDPQTLPLFQKELASDLLNLGSDIPYFMDPQPALISGIGETHSVFSHPFDFSGLLGIPPFGFSTPAMYKALDRPPLESAAPPREGTANESLNLKKTLQVDPNNPSNLNLAHQAFFSLADLFQDQTKPLPAFLLPEKQRGEEIGSYNIITNDFYETARQLDPQRWSIVDEALKTAASIMRLHLEEQGEAQPLIMTSMTGSGAAFFSGYVGQKKGKKATLSTLVKQAKEKRPGITWIGFSTRKE